MSPFYSSLDSDVDLKNMMILNRTVNANIPVILTAPHGGQLRFGSQSMMVRPSLPGVVTRGDLHTMELLILIDEYIRRRTCNEKRPHVVAARFHRQFIDANRNARIQSHAAYHPDCSNAQNVYDQYHGHIDGCIAHSLDSSPFSRALLLDIHGMGPYCDYVVVGTLNGQTCATSGSQSISQPHMGFLWHLRGLLGTTILPFPGCVDFPQYSGGYTVARHGGGRVDALQLEFGGFLRTVELRNQVAEAVGEAILRTVQPMRTFLQTLALVPSVHWRNDDIILVEEKLRKARCLTPADIVDRISCINKAFEKQGARKFFKKTLRVMLEMFDNCPPTSSCTKGKLHSKAGSFPPILALSSKLLPKEFIAYNQQNLVTTLNQSTSSVSIFDSRAVSSSDNSSVFTKYSTRANSLLPQYQRNIVRRIFIYDQNDYFEKEGTSYSGDGSSMILRNNSKGTTPSTVFARTYNDEIEAASNCTVTPSSSPITSGTVLFSMSDFLSGGNYCPAVLPGFLLTQDPSQCISCVRSSNTNESLSGYMVTFPDPTVFVSKLSQWQERLRRQEGGGNDRGDRGDRGQALALVPILARNTPVSRYSDSTAISTAGSTVKSCVGDFTDKHPSVSSSGPGPGPISDPIVPDEYLYSAYVCYNTTPTTPLSGLLEREDLDL